MDRGSLSFLIILLAWISGACRSDEPIPDERPVFVDAADLAGVVLIGGLDGGVGSGVAVSADSVLTAWHMIEPLLQGSGAFSFRLHERVAVGELIARGIERDWALIRVEPPRWSPGEAMPISADAVEGRWPEPGSELWLAGYASRMFPNVGVDPHSPAKMIRAVVVEPVEDEFVFTVAWSLMK